MRLVTSTDGFIGRIVARGGDTVQHFAACSRRLHHAGRPGYNFKFMAKLGFLGLGIMGYPMARNLLRAGHEVALWSHTAAKARALADAEKGGRFCATPREVGEFAECSFVCVGDTEMSKQVI